MAKKKAPARQPQATSTKKPQSPSHTKPAAGEPNLRRATELVMKLMAIPGRSGEETAVAEFIRQQLVAAGAPEDAITTDNAHKKTPITGEIGNLIFKLPGTIRAPRRLLMAHIDTVPICVGSKPKREGNLVRSANPKTGLGADNRAGAAVVLNTALEILQRKLPHPPLTFLWPVQEEIGLYGARNVKPASLGRPQLAFNWDGSAPDRLTIGATGGYRIEIEIFGQASHAGAAPEQGISATAIASLAIAQLVREGWHGLIEKPGGRQGTSNIGVIHGGDATNVVTDYVEIRAEARSHDSEFRQEIVNQIEQAFQDAAKQVRNAAGETGRVEIAGRLDYDSFRLASDEPTLLVAEQAVQDVGLTPERAVSNGGLDANWMNAHGIPTVTLGCGQMNIHTVNEQLDLAAFEQACKIALRVATVEE